MEGFAGHPPSQPPTTHALSVEVIFTVVHQLAKRRLVGFVFLTIASMVDGQINRLAHMADRERQCLPDRRCSADALGQLLAACFDLVLGTLPGHVVKRKGTGIFVPEASERSRNFGIPQSLSFLPRGMETCINHSGLVETQLVRTLFAEVEEYLHFIRHLRQFARSSPDGSCTASLSKEDGWYYWFRLRVENGPTICRHVHRFRAKPQMLAQFHAGCSSVADHMERYLETWDDSWLERRDAFGDLFGDIGDSSDYDNWIDLVEDADLLERLHRVEGHNQDGDELAAWNELQRIPAEHEYHVEVLRRRLLYCHYAEFVDHAALTRWARALVEAEPYDAINWTSLEYAVAGPDSEGHEAAAKVLREAVDRHGPNFILYYGLASRLCSLNRLDEAREAMGLALKEDPYAISSALDSTCFAPIWEFLSEVQDSQP